MILLFFSSFFKVSQQNFSLSLQFHLFRYFKFFATISFQVSDTKTENYTEKVREKLNEYQNSTKQISRNVFKASCICHYKSSISGTRYRVIFFTDRKVNVNYGGSNTFCWAESSATCSLGFTICEINLFFEKTFCFQFFNFNNKNYENSLLVSIQI